MPNGNFLKIYVAHNFMRLIILHQSGTFYAGVVSVESVRDQKERELVRAVVSRGIDDDDDIEGVDFTVR